MHDTDYKLTVLMEFLGQLQVRDIMTLMAYLKKNFSGAVLAIFQWFFLSSRLKMAHNCDSSNQIPLQAVWVSPNSEVFALVGRIISMFCSKFY